MPIPDTRVKPLDNDANQLSQIIPLLYHSLFRPEVLNMTLGDVKTSIENNQVPNNFTTDEVSYLRQIANGELPSLLYDRCSSDSYWCTTPTDAKKNQ